LQGLFLDILLPNTRHVCAVGIHDDCRVILQHFKLLIRGWGVHAPHVRLGADALQFLQHCGVLPAHVCIKWDLFHVRDVVPILVNYCYNFKGELPVAKQIFHVGTGVHGVVECNDSTRFFVELSCRTFLSRFACHGTSSKIAEFATFMPARDIALGAQQ
jgi:hypothetical protein